MKSMVTLLALAGALGAYLFSQPTVVERTHHYSADNVFYLREYVSFGTHAGAAGFSPGQEVRLDTALAPVAGKVTVTDGKDAAAVDLTMLTHDPDEAEALRASDAVQKSLVANLEVASPARRPVW